MAVHTPSPSCASSPLTPSEKDFYSSSDDKSIPQTQTREGEESHDESGARSNNDKEEEFESHDESLAQINNDDEDDDEEELRHTDTEPSPLNLIAPDSLSESQEFNESESRESDQHPKLATPISFKPHMAQGLKKPNIGESKGKALFKRLWPLEDEITILKAMVQYKSQNDLNNLKTRAFQDFVKKEIMKDLTLQVSNTQLFDKIRKLKRKYFSVAKHAKCSGKALVFPKSHDKIVYELGKKIWRVSDDDNKRRARGAGSKYDCRHGSLKVNFLFIKEAAERMGIKFAEEQLATISPGTAEFLVRRYRELMLLKMEYHEQEMELQMETFKLIREGIDRATREHIERAAR